MCSLHEQHAWGEVIQLPLLHPGRREWASGLAHGSVSSEKTYSSLTMSRNDDLKKFLKHRLSTARTHLHTWHRPVGFSFMLYTAYPLPSWVSARNDWGCAQNCDPRLQWWRQWDFPRLWCVNEATVILTDARARTHTRMSTCFRNVAAQGDFGGWVISTYNIHIIVFLFFFFFF